jgi:hypothetical protein
MKSIELPKEKEESPIRTFSIRSEEQSNDSDLDLHRSFDRFVQDLDSHRGLNDDGMFEFITYPSSRESLKDCG